MLCKIFHGGDYEECRLQGCYASVASSANVDPGSPILVILMMEALHSSETSVSTSVTRRSIPEDGILHVIASLTLIVTLHSCPYIAPSYSPIEIIR
jgi:hypothetical protein